MSVEENIAEPRKVELVAIIDSVHNLDTPFYEPECAASVSKATKLNKQILKWIRKNMDVDVDDANDARPGCISCV